MAAVVIDSVMVGLVRRMIALRLYVGDKYGRMVCQPVIEETYV